MPLAVSTQHPTETPALSVSPVCVVHPGGSVTFFLRGEPSPIGLVLAQLALDFESGFKAARGSNLVTPLIPESLPTCCKFSLPGPRATCCQLLREAPLDGSPFFQSAGKMDSHLTHTLLTRSHQSVLRPVPVRLRLFQNSRFFIDGFDFIGTNNTAPRNKHPLTRRETHTKDRPTA
jgi:hypothetical protein